MANNNFAPERHAVREQLLAHGDCPAGFAPVWRDFQALHGARQRNGFAFVPIAYQEIQAYVQLSRIELEPWEVELIRELDAIAVQAAAGALPVEE